MTYLVQHSSFDEMLDEMRRIAPRGRRIIRVTAGEVYLWRSTVSRIMTGVHVRTIDHENDTVLSCLIVTGYYDETGQRPFGPDAEQKKAAGNKKAFALKEDVTAHLSDMFRGCLINSGLLAVPTDVTWQPATWSRQEAEHA